MANFKKRTLLVTIDAVEHPVRLIPLDYVAFEREHGRQPENLADAMWITWHACTRLGVTALTLDEFLAGLEDLEEASGPLGHGSNGSSALPPLPDLTRSS